MNALLDYIPLVLPLLELTRLSNFIELLNVSREVLPLLELTRLSNLKLYKIITEPAHFAKCR